MDVTSQEYRDELAAEDELNLCIKEAQKFVNDSLFKCEVTDKLKETNGEKEV